MTDADVSSSLFTDDQPEPDLGTDFGGDERTPELHDLDGFGADEKKPRPHGRRNSVAGLVTMAWGGAGMMLVRTNADPPVGRVLQFEAPLAGKKIDELISGTWLDVILQPLVSQLDKIEGLGALLAFPLMVGAYERNPTIGPMIEPLLREVIRATLTDMAPLLKKQQADTKKAAAAISDLNEAFDLGPDEDPIQAVLASIFTPPEGGQDAPVQDE